MGIGFAAHADMGNRFASCADMGNRFAERVSWGVRTSAFQVRSCGVRFEKRFAAGALSRRGTALSGQGRHETGRVDSPGAGCIVGPAPKHPSFWKVPRGLFTRLRAQPACRSQPVDKRAPRAPGRGGARRAAGRPPSSARLSVSGVVDLGCVY